MSSKLVGDTNVETQHDVWERHVGVLYKFTCTASGTSEAIQMFFGSDTTALHVTLDLFSDVGGRPHTWLLGTAIFAPTPGAWHKESFGGVSLVAGTDYWLGFFNDPTNVGTGTGEVYDRHGGGTPAWAVESMSGVTGGIPSTWAGSPIEAYGPMSIFIEGAVAPVVGSEPLPTSNRVVHWETHRGRNTEFDKTESGTAVIQVQNRDGLFDPLNQNSPYTASDNLLPLRQVRITANHPWAVDTYVPIFTGYIESWEYERQGPRGSLATLHCVDGFELLNLAQVQPIKNQASGGQYFVELHVDDRIQTALDLAGWPLARRLISGGRTTVRAVTYDVGATMLQVIQDAADADFPGLANFYIDKSGNACFRGRTFRFDPFNPSHNAGGFRASNLYVFADDGAYEKYGSDRVTWSGVPFDSFLPMFNLTWEYNRQHLYNYVTVMPQDMLPENYWRMLVRDVDSARRYGKRDLSITDLIVAAGDAVDGNPVQSAAQVCKAYAMYYLQNYANPRVRATQLEVHSKFEDQGVWDFLVNVEIGDVISLYTVNPGGGGFFGDEFFVDGISNVVDAEGDWPKWVTTLDLTPRAFWGAQIPGYSSPDDGSWSGPVDQGLPPPSELGPMVFEDHVAGYTDGEVENCAIEYATPRGYPDSFYPHKLQAGNGTIEYHGPTPGVYILYYTPMGSTTEWTPLHH